MDQMTKFVYKNFPNSERGSQRSDSSGQTKKYKKYLKKGLEEDMIEVCSKGRSKAKLGNEIEDGEEIIDEFNCALKLKILV